MGQLWLLLALLVMACADAFAATKPNVLLICVDDLKPTLGCYGDKLVRSPHLDRLAARGVLFERAYCNQAVCAPSRNALLTGVRPTSLGIYDLGTNFRVASSNAVTLPQYFMRHGYRTEALGKIFHVGHGNHEDPASWSVPHWPAKSIAYVLPESRANQGLTREEALFGNENVDLAKLPRGAPYESADVPDEAYPDGRIAAEAIRRLRAAKDKPDEPFFLAVGFLKPHLPFCAPKRYWDLYDRAAFTVPALRTAPAGAPRYAPSGWGELRQYNGMPTNGPVTDDQARALIHGYYAAVSYMDAQLGKVLDELDRLQLATNTVIVLWGDHGWHLGDHGWWCKHSNYEQANRLPLLVVAPGVARPGSRATNALIESVDIYPTLAELAGLPAPQVPQGIEGRSFAGTLRNPNQGARNYIFHVYPRGERLGRAVRTTRYRLVEWKIPGAAADTAAIELYDYETDPLETRNLATDNPDVVGRMRAMLATLPEAKPQIARPRASSARRWADRPNLLFVIADQWRAQAFGFAGDPNVKTPHLDQFERQSVHFTQAIAGMPVCSPTRASLLTGQRPLTHGVFLNDVPLSTNAVTLPKVLKAAGYDTGCIGKWHVDGHGSRSAFIPRERRQEFDYWKVLECTHAYNNSHYYADGPEKLKWDGYDAIAQTRDAQEYLRGRAKAARPFLLWLSWGPPHNPYETAPAKYRAMYSPDNIRLHPNVPESARPTARKELAGYYAHCTALDDCFADLLRTLDETGLATNTIVVFTSDHGDMLWSQNQQRKQRPWEESARIPLLLRLPASLGIEPKRLPATINTEDIMPTLLALCGLPIPGTVEGLDFSRAMRGEPDPSGGAALVRCVSPFGEFTRARGGREYRAVRTMHHTYVRDLNGPWLLYDNLADPYQTNNLVGQPPQARLQAELDALLKKKLAEQKDEFLPGPEYVKRWGYKVDAQETVPYAP